MNAVAISLVAFVCCFCGMHIGMAIGKLLPDDHLSGDSKEIVKIGAGLIATMTALVLGLLVSSSKDTLDTMNRQLVQDGAKIIQLDRILSHYGPDAANIRQTLQADVRQVLHQYWHEDVSQEAVLENIEVAQGSEKLQASLRALKPANENERQLLADAQQLSSEIAQSRWFMIEMAERDLPQAFLVVLLLWLLILYLCYGLIAPPNGTVKIVLFASALTGAAAIFLILEMNNPLTGAIKVSSAPMRMALNILSR
jgi:hypothetical protein